MRRFMLPLGLAAMLYSPFFCAQAQPSLTPVTADPALVGRALTLADALALAESRSFGLAVARREVAAADGALMQAGAWRNPTLSASVEGTRRDTRTTTATIDLPVERGGKRAARVTAAERSRDVAQAELAHARAQLRASVVAAFFGVLVAQEREALAQASLVLASRAAEVAARRVAAGKVSPVDETRARVDASNAQLEAREAEGESQSARLALAALWGETQPPFDRAQGDLDALPSRPAWPDLAAALDAAPGLAASRLEIDRRQALVDVERSQQHADVTLSIGAKRDNELGRTQATIGISIPLQLFDHHQGQVHEARQRAEQASDAHQAERVRLSTDLHQASVQLALARTSAETLRGTVLPAAQQASDAAVRGFEAGKFGFLDVLDAQRVLLQARARHLATLAAAHQAAATIDRILGR